MVLINTNFSGYIIQPVSAIDNVRLFLMLCMLRKSVHQRSDEYVSQFLDMCESIFLTDRSKYTPLVLQRVI